MSPYHLNFRVFLLCLAFGLAVAPFVEWLTSDWHEVHVQLPEANAEVVLVDVRQGLDGFVYVARGCFRRDEYGGSGWGESYSWSETENVSRSGSGYGSRKKAKRVLELRVSEAAEVLEDSRSHHVTSPVRVVLRHQDKTGEWFEILEYDGEDYIEDISANDLNLVLMFENWIADKKN